jgi:hypothetical protein
MIPDRIDESKGDRRVMTAQPRRLSAAILILVSSGACSGSGEPTRQDIIDAMQAQAEKSYAAMVEMAGEERAKEMRPELHDVKLIGCEEATGRPGFQCDVEVDATGMLGRQTQTTSIRIVNGEDGWVLVK